MKHIDEILKVVAEATGAPPEQVADVLEIPPDQSLGDISVPCFVFAKAMKKSPVQVASELKQKIKSKHLKDVRNEGPYLNFHFEDDFYAESILLNKAGTARENSTIMIEFSQPNTHKEFHVGHLRNVCIGDSLVRILGFMGNRVVAANYIGDIGTHVAKTLWCLENFHRGEKIPPNRGRYLGSIYVEANKRLEADESLKEQVSRVLQDLESRKPEITRKWAETREWSIDEFRKIYKDLGVKFDKYYFESEEDLPARSIAGHLLNAGIAKKSEGAVIVDLEKFKLGVAVILKSDGTTLYLTKDLSLGQKKFSDYSLDKSIYVVDSRQTMHLQQVFKILELMGFRKDMVHVSYEFVSTKEGPISSRTGRTYLYEELKERLVQKLSEETSKRHPDWSKEKIRTNSEHITVAALKFGMLKFENNKEVVFDEDQWLDFEGETGPYVAYTYARIKSILRKAESPASAELSMLRTDEDRSILRILSQESRIISDSARNYKPSLIARYVLDLSQKMNEYYHKHQILKADETTMNARLVLLGKVAETINRGMILLGIELPEEM